MTNATTDPATKGPPCLIRLNGRANLVTLLSQISIIY